ncbi:hypothetical protein BSKO_02108 [Bryopsis sp. KO-2023]|nr:hypothetical protein BSKO_02108 [Bryopsis sp. KO-2023]
MGCLFSKTFCCGRKRVLESQSIRLLHSRKGGSQQVHGLRDVFSAHRVYREKGIKVDAFSAGWASSPVYPNDVAINIDGGVVYALVWDGDPWDGARKIDMLNVHSKFSKFLKELHGNMARAVSSTMKHILSLKVPTISCTLVCLDLVQMKGYVGGNRKCVVGRVQGSFNCTNITAEVLPEASNLITEFHISSEVKSIVLGSGGFFDLISPALAATCSCEMNSHSLHTACRTLLGSNRSMGGMLSPSDSHRVNPAAALVRLAARKSTQALTRQMEALVGSFISIDDVEALPFESSNAKKLCKRDIHGDITVAVIGLDLLDKSASRWRIPHSRSASRWNLLYLEVRNIIMHRRQVLEQWRWATNLILERIRSRRRANNFGQRKNMSWRSRGGQSKTKSHSKKE